MKDWTEAAAALADVTRRAHSRGWIPGGSGNFSVVLKGDPFELAITPSARDKAQIGPGDIVRVDREGRVISGPFAPSSETSIHLAITRALAVGAVAHTHSRAATLLSGIPEPGVAIEGYELLKGLSGVRTHDHAEWLPIIENSQDWPTQAPAIEQMLLAHPGGHAFLIRRHGLYTWGQDLDEVFRHLEVIEFLLDILVSQPLQGVGRG